MPVWNFFIPLAAIVLITACTPKTPGTGTLTGEKTGKAKIQISRIEARNIGNQIWKNECSGTIPGLTGWNRGEYFASLGIGHFIWYHREKRGPFEESFPPLVRYIQSRGIPVPQIARQQACPWTSREDFQKALNSPAMVELGIPIINNMLWTTSISSTTWRYRSIL